MSTFGRRLLCVVTFVYVLVLSGCSVGASPLFEPAPRILSIAQTTEVHRSGAPTPRNLCSLNVYVVFYNKVPLITTDPNTPSTPATTQKIFQKFFESQGSNYLDHCEQLALRWLQYNTLPNVVAPLIAKGNVAGIYVLLYTQVRACLPCKPTFADWDQKLALIVHGYKKGGSVEVKLFVWEIRYLSPSGFDPGDYPAGPDTPGNPKLNTYKPRHIVIDDLQQVYP